jgi:PPK2 family polyphosphate:nucleotide phosphotransferase
MGMRQIMACGGILAILDRTLQARMKIDTEAFRVSAGKKFRIGKRPTLIDPFYASKDEYRTALAGDVDKLRALQDRLYASNAYSILFILQAMDTAGKDGVIKHVMSGVNPQGCQVFSFKHPSDEELDHDFLWRAVRNLPERGRIGIFNRSYYEEVLIVRVHPEILAGERLPGVRDERSAWKERYRSITGLEHHLHANGTRIVKVFLHLSKEEQKKRLLARIDDPAKNWKFGDTDLKERGFWKQYMSAYEDCLAATSTKHSPWYVVPADDKANARLIVSRILVETLEKLKLDYPRIDAAQKRKLQAMRKQLT